MAHEFWIKDAVKNKGGLHKSLGISEDKTIPSGTLSKAAKKGGKVGKEARLAQTLKGFKHGGKKVDKAPDQNRAGTVGGGLHRSGKIGNSLPGGGSFVGR